MAQLLLATDNWELTTDNQKSRRREGSPKVQQSFETGWKMIFPVM